MQAPHTTTALILRPLWLRSQGVPVALLETWYSDRIIWRQHCALISTPRDSICFDYSRDSMRSHHDASLRSNWAYLSVLQFLTSWNRRESARLHVVWQVFGRLNKLYMRSPPETTFFKLLLMCSRALFKSRKQIAFTTDMNQYVLK